MILRGIFMSWLEEVGLSLDDICGITTDGDNTMIKFGRLLIERAKPKPFFHQLCHAHGLHLAVRDTLPYPGDREKQWKIVAIPSEENKGECIVIAVPISLFFAFSFILAK